MKMNILFIIIFFQSMLFSQEDTSWFDLGDIEWSIDRCNSFKNPTEFEKKLHTMLGKTYFNYFSESELKNLNIGGIINSIEKKYKMFDYNIIYNFNGYLRVVTFNFFISDTNYFQLALCLPKNEKFYIANWYDKCREDLNFQEKMSKKFYKLILLEKDFEIHQINCKLDLKIISFLNKANEKKFYKLLKDYQKSKKKNK